RRHTSSLRDWSSDVCSSDLTQSLSQLTFLFNYASDRVTNRGPSNLSGNGFQPDIVERPGIRFDIVARQGFELAGGKFELKLEGRSEERRVGKECRWWGATEE